MIPLLPKSEMLDSVAVQPGLCWTWTRFCRDAAQIKLIVRKPVSRVQDWILEVEG